MLVFLEYAEKEILQFEEYPLSIWFSGLIILILALYLMYNLFFGPGKNDENVDSFIKWNGK